MDADLIELLEPALCATLNITPAAELVGRAERLAVEARKERHPVAAGKRCSPHRRCRNLACLVCRRRAQLDYVATHAKVLKGLVKRTKGWAGR